VIIPVVEALISAILIREGWPKYTNDPADHGGPTKGGITIPDLELFREKRCTAVDIENLTEDEVRAIYRFQYITHWKFDQIPDPWAQEFIIDTGVLQGQGTAAKMLQAVLGVPQDGNLGPTTFASLSLALVDHAKFEKELVRARMHLLLDAMVSDVAITLRQTTNLKWRHGWWNRVCDFL
jgi:lysozyme family protein